MRILLVKLSSLGDIVHTLPVVQDILLAMPGAQIDWVVEKAFAPLLTQVQGINRIIPCELRRWRKSFWSAQTRTEWRAFKADLQKDSYDVVLDFAGAASLDGTVALLRDGGRVVSIADARAVKLGGVNLWVRPNAADLAQLEYDAIAARRGGRIADEGLDACIARHLRLLPR